MSDYKTDLNEHQLARKEKIQTVVKDFANVMNTFSRDGDVFFIDAFCREHRTIQQSMFGVFAKLIGHMASDEFRTDGRNEQSKTYAKAFLNGLRSHYEQIERDHYENAGYGSVEVDAKLAQFRESFDKDPSVYLNLSCV